jgi:hypothetical protein
VELGSLPIRGCRRAPTQHRDGHDAISRETSGRPERTVGDVPTQPLEVSPSEPEIKTPVRCSKRFSGFPDRVDIRLAYFREYS